jgi:hypothetical protein
MRFLAHHNIIELDDEDSSLLNLRAQKSFPPHNLSYLRSVAEAAITPASREDIAEFEHIRLMTDDLEVVFAGFDTVPAAVARLGRMIQFIDIVASCFESSDRTAA